MQLLTFGKCIQEEYDSELKFYLSYHRNLINWRNHAICVPLEWFGWLMILSSFRLHAIMCCLICSYYALLKSKMRLPAITVHLFLTYCAEILSGWLGSSWHIFFVAILIEFVVWSLQLFVGHYLFEKNHPAMRDKLTINSIALSVILAWDGQTLHEH